MDLSLPLQIFVITEWPGSTCNHPTKDAIIALIMAQADATPALPDERFEHIRDIQGSAVRLVRHKASGDERVAKSFADRSQFAREKETLKKVKDAIGSNGVSFSGGSHRNTVSRSTFSDISASAVAIGTRSGSVASMTEKQFDINNTVSDCTITDVANEYRGHPGILVGFSHGTTIEHNEVAYVPYTAISLGWGWSGYPHTFDGANSIVANNIHHHMQVLGDGGAIYTLGTQGNMPFLNASTNTSAILSPSMQARNWIHEVLRIAIEMPTFFDSFY